MRRGLRETLQRKVEYLLETVPETRGDDFLLIEKVVGQFVDTEASFSAVMRGHDGLPSFAGIVRARRKIQKENPDLLPDTEKVKLRSNEEESYRAYYGGRDEIEL